VAQHLKEKHGIDCHIALPKLNKDKYDFNDVLKEKGLDEVKQQLRQDEKIEVPDKLKIIEKETLQNNLKDNLSETLPSGYNTTKNNNGMTIKGKTSPGNERLQNAEINWLDKRYEKEWQALEQVDNAQVKWMLQYIDDAKNNRIEKPEVVVNQRINKLSIKAASKNNVMKTLQRLAPDLAKAMKQQYQQHQKKREINRGRDR